ncbi:hypothetical protein AVDCRST_MAG94-6125, partial [uncultured Leptolyngbya sp.]
LFPFFYTQRRMGMPLVALKVTDNQQSILP